MKKVVLLLLCLSLILGFAPNAQAKAYPLNKSQTKLVKTIYRECSKEKNWKKYGCLPSVTAAQAFIESCLGKARNIFGINGRSGGYSSYKQAVHHYFKVINNGYYKGAPHKKNYKVQIDKILDGGYCQPRGSYYSKAIRSIQSYDWDKLDKKMFKKFKRIAKKRREEKKKKREVKERLKRQMAQFEVMFSDEVPIGSVEIDKKIVRKGIVSVNDTLYEVKPKSNVGQILIFNTYTMLRDRYVFLDAVFENAVG